VHLLKETLEINKEKPLLMRPVSFMAPGFNLLLVQYLEIKPNRVFLKKLKEKKFIKFQGLTKEQ